MKHLRKYNEASDEEVFDKDYIEQCFIEFYDNPDMWNMHVYIGAWDPYGKKCGFKVQLKNPWISKDFSIEEYLKLTNDMSEFALDINMCIDRLKQQYNIIDTNIRTMKTKGLINPETFQVVNTNTDVYEIYFYVDNSKKLVKPGFEKGKLNTISSSELDGTWQVKGEE
jgi:hypothetical protein